MMNEFGLRWWRGVKMRPSWMVLFVFASVLASVSAERLIMKMEVPSFNGTAHEPGRSFLTQALNFLWQSEDSGYHHVWPVSLHFLRWILYLFLFSLFLKFKAKKLQI